MTPPTPKIRLARPDELAWVNARYEEVGFQPSRFETERIVIAELGDTRVGVGRLLLLDQEPDAEPGQVAELGGMYVAPEARGQGVADAIVRFLLMQGHDRKTIYCLPFAHLAGFYRKHGFAPCEDAGGVPEFVLKKHRWCNDELEHRTLLFVLKR